MQQLVTITQQELGGKLHTGQPDSPELGTRGMQELFDAHPNLNTEKLNENARIQNQNNAAVQAHMDNTQNPHGVTREQVGLGSADNTADMDKPVSTAQQAAIGAVQHGVDALAANVLRKDNTLPYEPTGAYHPCTKAYADQLAFDAGAVTSVFGRAGAVTAQAGDYTPELVGAAPADETGAACNAAALGGVEASQYVQYPTHHTGNPVKLDTTAAQVALPAIKGCTKIDKPNPAADISPDNVATLTGVEYPAFMAADGQGNSNSATLPYTLYSLPNGVCDEYDALTGRFVQRVGKLVLDGTEPWVIQGYINSDDATAFNFFVTNMAASNNLYSTHFEPWIPFGNYKNKAYFTGNNTRFTFSVENSIIGITAEDSENTSVDKAKSYLSAQAAAGTPVTVLYELAEPIIRYHDLKLPCCDGQTTVSCADPVLQEMSVTVAGDKRVFDAERLGGTPSSKYAMIESGTWTPVGENCTVSNIVSALYTVCGNLVFLTARFTLTPISGSANPIMINNIPYFAKGFGVVSIGSFPRLAVNTTPAGVLNTSYIYFPTFSTTSSTTGLTGKQVYNSGLVDIAAVYTKI